ncbi:cadherin domain-containing protein [Roseibium marinum]|uniref:Uncharacterized protein DUF4114 n=1 Tax=Roseibium marinum TaxID=281252 RepID=A0A2S3ULD8_9HYPH|nr:cadherin domain-containing protein [Roseibium marinum]POF28505.1 uncharacterized protein DUF4114 [Roseibium marinum]
MEHVQVMADTDTSANAEKPGVTPSGADAAKNTGGNGPAPARVDAQAGDPYRPDSGNDYSLSIEPEDTGEATVANLFQAVPLENEGPGSSNADAGGQGGDGTGPDGAAAGRLGDGPAGDGSGGTLLPDGATDVVETSAGLQNGDAGLGDGAVPEARGLDANLPQFDLGGNGIQSAGSQVGDGTDGGVPSDGGGSGGAPGGTAGVGPVSDVDTVSNTVQENAAGGTVVGVTAFAQDPDSTDTVTYSITDDRFEIDPDTGVITVADGAVIDRETTPLIDLEVTATSSDGTTSTGSFEITVGDENEFPIGPVSDVDTVTNTVQENASGGTVVGVTAFAQDPDSTDTVTYSITDDRFEIDPDTGVITVADGAVIDRETTPVIDLEVTATSSDGTTSSGSFEITVGDENEFPIGPVSDVDTVSNTVQENAAGGTVVGVTAFAQDPDSTDTVTYSIADDRFEIDPDTGVITVADGAVIDRETTPLIDLEVTATSSDGTTSTGSFEITVGDENEFPIGPVSDVDTVTNTVQENAAGGTVVGVTAFAQDPDSTDTVTYSITDDRFEIDPDTGVITVADGVSFDHETLPSVDIEVTATSSDGSDSTGIFTVDIIDVNEPPDLTVHLENGAKQFAVNGSFEVYDGSLGGTDGSGWYQNPNTIEGWSYDNVDVHQAGHMNFGATDGGHHLDLAALTNGWASQQIEGQLDGQVYHLTFDMKSRGGPGQSVAEVYWNGELIDTIDPATTGNGWQTFSYDIVGGSGDGSNTLSYVEIGSDNNGGALIDSVSIVSDHRTAVVEEFYGAEIAPLSVIDPDVGDSHTFIVSDDRFEVVASDGIYLLKLKSDQAFDYETETQVTVEVTATDTGGLSDTETVIIDIIDIDETNAPVGPLRDTDVSSNTVAENGSGGTAIGITAFADDPDGGDTVTYSITDERFEIDPDTGVITVRDGVSFDHETLPSLDIEVTATSSDGSSSTGLFTVDVTDVNEAPVLAFDPAMGPGVEVTMTFIEEHAGYGNVFGVYYGNANGDPVGGEIVWVDQNRLSPGDTATVYLEGVEAGDVGYFLIPDGGNTNKGLTSGDKVSFLKDGDGNWQAVLTDGTLLAGRDANVVFSGDGTLNPDGYDYTAQSGITIGFEDIAGGGDQDFDDLVFDQTLSESNADASIYEEEAGAEVGTLTAADPDLGDVQSFSVSDDRFEVIARNGEFVLKLKDDVAIDHENEDSITLDVTATDSGGLTDTQTITLDIVDTDDGRGSEYGTPHGETMAGDRGGNTLFGRGGDDILLGQGGNDRLYGEAGDDVLRGGTGNDHMSGGDGSDVFAYMLGDGNDQIYGGAGLNWIDIVDLGNAADGAALGSYGSDWSVTMTEGTIESIDAFGGEITLSQDADGYIELADGARIDFTDLESIQY